MCLELSINLEFPENGRLGISKSIHAWASVKLQLCEDVYMHQLDNPQVAQLPNHGINNKIATEKPLRSKGSQSKQ
jgi:hypothetical protein